jgi:undecaprenyl-diphosphatase
VTILENQLLVVAADAFAAFFALGVVVMRLPHSRFDTRGDVFRGMATRVARVLTESGRGLWLTVVGVTILLIFVVMRWPLWIPLAVFASQLVSQALVEGAKRLYRRIRPRDWLVRDEHGFSYPSGHSATAVTFYGMWAVVIMYSPAPLAIRATMAGVIIVWAIGIAWSRLALSAHYATDVLGGLFFGAGWTCATLALLVYAKIRLQ